MKKIGVIIGISTLFLLSGCMNPTSVRIVEDMYRAAIMEEDTKVESYFSEEFMLENEPFSEVKDKIHTDAINMKGIEFMNTTEIREKDLNPEIAEGLNDTFDEWSYIVTQIDEDQIMTWVVQRGETQYYIVEGKAYPIDAYNEEVLENS
ncbi:hypothetical protein [Oceanobacillus bengalensis]|uniref:DUF4878 domain-containing protein n=1 Tax=Oceanobacillus bengalensis TaxID=1435466 RepID=A0A494Z2U7_9BACI|nr:hypothetical protein [Oceanobacillus bengalensis]RKQ16618.1 hypothetical protein D8M05_07010 [Oceanobacillus bengalensis]